MTRDHTSQTTLLRMPHFADMNRDGIEAYSVGVRLGQATRLIEYFQTTTADLFLADYLPLFTAAVSSLKKSILKLQQSREERSPATAVAMGTIEELVIQLGDRTANVDAVLAAISQSIRDLDIEVISALSPSDDTSPSPRSYYDLGRLLAKVHLRSEATDETWGFTAEDEATLTQLSQQLGADIGALLGDTATLDVWSRISNDFEEYPKDLQGLYRVEVGLYDLMSARREVSAEGSLLPHVHAAYLAAYRLGVRLGQAQLVHRYAEHTSYCDNASMVRHAVQRISSALVIPWQDDLQPQLESLVGEIDAKVSQLGARRPKDHPEVVDVVGNVDQSLVRLHGTAHDFLSSQSDTLAVHWYELGRTIVGVEYVHDNRLSHTLALRLADQLDLHSIFRWFDSHRLRLLLIETGMDVSHLALESGFDDDLEVAEQLEVYPPCFQCWSHIEQGLNLLWANADLPQSIQAAGLPTEEHPAVEHKVWRSGDDWVICYHGGDPIPIVRHKAGMFYLAWLLSRPHEEFQVHELEAEKQRWQLTESRSVSAGEASATGISFLRASDAGAILDVVEVRLEVTRLRAEISAAEGERDEERVAGLHSQLADLEEAIANAHDPQGRLRRLADEDKRLRDRICNSIQRTVDELENKSPSLAAHLRKSLDPLGKMCCYRPDQPIEWNTPF